MNLQRRRQFKMVKRLIHHNQKVIEMNTGSDDYQYRECICFDICTIGATRSRRTEDARLSRISEHVERGNPAGILEHNTKYVICKDDKCSSGNRMSQEDSLCQGQNCDRLLIRLFHLERQSGYRHTPNDDSD